MNTVYGLILMCGSIRPQKNVQQFYVWIANKSAWNYSVDMKLDSGKGSWYFIHWLTIPNGF